MQIISIGSQLNGLDATMCSRSDLQALRGTDGIVVISHGLPRGYEQELVDLRPHALLIAQSYDPADPEGVNMMAEALVGICCRVYGLTKGWNIVQRTEPAQLKNLLDFLSSDARCPSGEALCRLLDLDRSLVEVGFRVALEIARRELQSTLPLGTTLKSPVCLNADQLLGPALALGAELSAAVSSFGASLEALRDTLARPGRELLVVVDAILAELAVRDSLADRMQGLPRSRYAAWNRRRVSLKHNWFDRLAGVLRALPEKADLPASFSGWPEKYQQLVQWLDETPRALSPEQLLELPAFAPWPAELRARSAIFLYQRFLESPIGIERIVHDCQRILREIDRAVRAWRPTGEIQLDQREAVTELIETASRSLQRIPSGVSWPEPSTFPLAHVLVFDDLLGRYPVMHSTGPVLSHTANRELYELRRAFFHQFHLMDSDSEASPAQAKAKAIARASVCSGQRFDAQLGFVNDLGVVQAWMHEMKARGPCALVVVDLRFNTGIPDEHGRGTDETMFGIDDILPWLRETHPELPVVVLTTESQREIRERVRSYPGVEYLHRSNASEVDLLMHLLRGERATPEQLRNAMSVPPDLVAEDTRSMQVLYQAWAAARSRDGNNILIVGESGSGKERIAQFIHDQSARRSASFVVVNCAQFEKGLADSQLFGFYRGAFEGARADTAGVFQSAAGGTLVLDEFADLDEHVQPKLLRVLQGNRAQKRVIEPVGRAQTGARLATEVDVRVICCTSRDLTVLREDLLNRMHTVLSLAPLRERPQDIVPLAIHILSSPDCLGAPGLELDLGARQYLVEHPLPGNVRTLRRLLEATTQGKGKLNTLTRQDLELAWTAISHDPRIQPMPSSSGYLVSAPQARKPPIPPSDAASLTSGDGSLSEAIATILSTHGESGWEHLSKAQIDALDRVLSGHLAYVIAAIAEWAFFRAQEAPTWTKYVTGETAKGRAPQDLVKRLLKLHPQVLEQIVNSKYAPMNPTLAMLIKDCVSDKEKAKQRLPLLSAKRLSKT